MSTIPKRPLVDLEHQVVHVHRPADGSLIEDLPIDDPGRVADVVRRLRAAQPEWEELGVHGRTRWLKGMRDWLLDSSERISDVMQEETGKVRAETKLEQSWVNDIINTYARTAPNLLADKPVRAGNPILKGKRFTVVRRPHPVVGIIGPWNFPLVLSFGDAIPALFAGCAVVIKPSEITPLTLREVVRGWREVVGGPAVLDAVFGGGDTGAALIDEVDYVGFTGSVATGQKVAQRAAATVTPVSLELGGKDPFIVLDGANITRAANCVTQGGFGNNGQICMSIERVYVEAPVYDEFVEKVVANVQSLRSGMDGAEFGSDLGALTSPAQLSIIDDHVQDAVDKGAKVLTGGRIMARDGDWYEPTVLVDVDHTMKVMTDETFGPVLPIMKVADEAEAVRLANDSEFGLGASVFARDAKDGERVARLIDSGTVNVNDYGTATFCIDMPMGGWKKSGIGSRSADYGLLKYTRQKSISSPLLPVPERELFWFPYTTRRQRLLGRAFRFVNARGRARLGGRARRNA